MKKLMLVLAMLFVAAPAMAAVVVTADCADNSGVYTVSFTADANLPRAFALDIEVDAGTIDAVGSLSADYDIYPGSIVIVDGEVNDPGSAVCDASYPDTLGGLGTAGITVEMGSLYADGEAAPTPGVLFTFTVSDSSATVTVTENAIRGGVVMEDPDEDPALSVVVNQCPQGGCTTCAGDIDGNNQIDLTDLTLMVNILSAAGAPYQVPVTPGVDDCADMDTTGIIDLTDLTNMVNTLSGAGAPYIVPCP